MNIHVLSSVFITKNMRKRWKSFQLTPAVCQKSKAWSVSKLMHLKIQCQITHAIFLAFMEAYGFHKYEDALSIQLFLVITALSGLYWFYPVLQRNKKERVMTTLELPIFQICEKHLPFTQRVLNSRKIPHILLSCELTYSLELDWIEEYQWVNPPRLWKAITRRELNSEVVTFTTWLAVQPSPLYKSNRGKAINGSLLFLYPAF